MAWSETLYLDAEFPESAMDAMEVISGQVGTCIECAASFSKLRWPRAYQVASAQGAKTATASASDFGAANFFEELTTRLASEGAGIVPKVRQQMFICVGTWD